MPSTTRSFQTRLDAVTADHARREADRCGLSLEEWVVSVLRRELRHAGQADGLALRTYEVAVASLRLQHALMLDRMGPEATARAVEQAVHAAREAIAAELAYAAEVDR